MAFKELVQCDHCQQEIDTTKPYVEVALRHNRLPNFDELVRMGVYPDGTDQNEAIRLRDENFSRGALSMVRDENLLHFCNDEHFAQYQPQ